MPLNARAIFDLRGGKHGVADALAVHEAQRWRDALAWCATHVPAAFRIDS